jgi:MFS family permease
MTATTAQPYPPATLAWFMWGLGAALYLNAFYQRVAPGVMTGELSADFGLDGAALGNLSAFYFYSYVAMQIPVGVLADRLGPRKLLTLGAVLGGIGAALFSVATDVHWAQAGRLLVGGGAAVAFVSMLKLADHWMAPRHFSLATGLALLTGISGAVFAGVPLHLAIGTYGWRQVMLASALVPLVIGVAIWLLVRDDPSERGYRSYGHASGALREPVFASIARVLCFRNTWIMILVPGGVVGATLTFAGLWGVPFLTSHYGMAKSEAAALNTAMLVAWAIGSPLFGAWSDRIGRRKLLYIGGTGSLIVFWTIVIFVPDLPMAVLTGLLLCIGFASGCMAISYAFAKESVPRQFAGTVSGVCNSGSMLGPMILQPAVGLVLDRYGMPGSGLLYSLEAYRAGFALMLGWVVIAFILILFSRETYCRHYASGAV